MPLLYITINNLPIHRIYSGRILYYMIDAFTHDLYTAPYAADFLSSMSSEPRLRLAVASNDFQKVLRNSLSLCDSTQIFTLPFAAFPTLPSQSQELDNSRFLICMSLDGVFNALSLKPRLSDVLLDYSVSVKSSELLQDQLTSREFESSPISAIVSHFKLEPNWINNRKMLSLVGRIDSWLKLYRRERLARLLQYYDVDVAGTGWDNILGQNSNIKLLGSISHSNYSHMISNYKALINLDPNWNHGYHDRVFTALFQGVPVLTQSNEMHAELNPDVSTNVFQFLPNLEDFHEAVARAQIVTSASRSIVFDNSLTWIERAHRLLGNVLSI